MELNDEDVKKLVEYSKKYYQNVDESFFGGLAEILSNIGERMKNVTIETDNYIQDKDSNVPKNLDLKIFEIVGEFYKSLSSDLGDMAENQLRHAPIYMTEDNLDEEDLKFLKARKIEPKSLFWGDYMNVPLEKSWDAVAIAAHEIAHRFTFNDYTSIMPENLYYDMMDDKYIYQAEHQGYWRPHIQSSINKYILQETIAIYAELLCTDFIKGKHGIDISTSLLKRTRYNSISAYAKKPEITEIELLKSLKNYVGLLKTEELNENSMPKYKIALTNLANIYNKICKTIYPDEEQIEEIALSLYMLNMSNYEIFSPHRVGFIFANYLYQLSLGNKQKQVEIFNTMLSAISIIEEFGRLTENDLEYPQFEEINSRIGIDEIAYIQKTGLPITKDGKLQMNYESVQAILRAFDQSMIRDKAILIKQKDEGQGVIKMCNMVSAAIEAGTTFEEIYNFRSNLSYEKADYRKGVENV